MYWFYLHQKDGKTGRTVKNFLEQIYRDGRLAAFADRPDFYSEFKEYALWNFNTPPFTYYEDADGAPSLRPHGLCVKHEKLPAGEQYFEFVFIPQGGVMYYVYKFDRDVEKIRFDLTQLQKTAENQNGIQIVYSADGQDYVEDVSYRDELIFCRNRPAENINEIVFIISNANLDESDRNADLDVEMPIDTRGICIPEWSGFVNCSCASSGPGDGFGTNLYGGSYSSNASSRIDATLLYDPNENQFYAETQEIQHTSSYYWYVEYPVTEVQVTFGYTAWEDKTRQGSGSRSIEYDLGDTCPPECPSDALMIKQYEDDNETLYIHRSQTYRDLGTFKETHQVMNIAGEICEGNDWCVDELWVDEDVHSLSATIPPDPMLLHMNDDGTHMYGTLTDGACSCTAEFSYE